MNSSTYTQFFNSLLSIGSYVLLFFYSILLLPNYMKRKQIDYLSFVKTVFYAIAICMAFAVAAGFTDPKAFHFDPFSLRNRYLGFFRHPNFMGLYAFLGFLVTVLLFYLTKKRGYLAAAPAYGYLVYLSASRTALTAIFLLLLIVLLRKYVLRSLHVTIRNSVPIVLGVGLLTVCVFHFIDLQTVLSEMDQLLSNRVTIWTHFLFSNETWGEYLVGQGMESSKVSRDNYYFVVLLNTGFLGLSIFLMMVTYSLHVLLRRFSSSSFMSLELLISFFIVLLVYSFTESILFTLGNSVSFFLWCSIGIHFNLIHEGQGQQSLEIEKKSIRKKLKLHDYENPSVLV
ncbi:O-antigen ligase family protein [Paenibacillus validus]|uniref:O-antigen ligase family protein n=1 Tax=Paenibacillus validus TaxID=44253 RepID=UPI003D2DC459